MILSTRLLRSHALRPLGAAALAAALTMGFLPFVLPTGRTVLACSDASSMGSNNAAGSGGCPPGVPPAGNSAPPPSGGSSSFWYCSYGNDSWRFPRDTTGDNSPAKPQSSTALIESSPYSPESVAAYWQWHLDEFSSWWYSAGKGYTQNSSSFFWENGFADMLASDLMIEPISASAANNWTGDPTSGSILHLRTEAARTALMDKQVLSVRTGPDDSWWNSYSHVASPASYFNVQVVRYPGIPTPVTVITLTVPGSSTARAWEPGTEPVLSSGGGLTPSAIKNALAARFDGADLNSYIPQDSQGYTNAKPYVWAALNASYVAGYPYEILIKTPTDSGFKVWTAAQLSNASFPAGTLWNVQIVMPARSAIYSSLEQVHQAFLQVVRDQMAAAWNQVAYRSDLSGTYGPNQPGRAFYPVFAYPFYFDGASSRPATQAEANSSIGTDACGSDSIAFFNMTFSRDRTSSPACGTAFVEDAATYDSQVTAPDTCWAWWVFQDIPPPRISQQSWDAAIERTSKVALRLSSPAVLVNQTVALAPAAIPPAAINFSSSDSDLDAVVTYNLTQLGITVSLGRTLLKTVPYDPSDPTGGYSFTLSFAETPLAHLQDPVCTAATSAADLLARCGIVFKYDSVSKRVEPFYRVTVQTWWSGMYYVPGLVTASGSNYCSLFSSACSHIDPVYASRISAWNSAFSPVIRADDGSDLGWPSLFGSPIYSAG